MEYSVLMSVYYKEKPEWLKIAIESMLNQTVKPAEMVIVKDGKLSSELDAVIEEFENNYPKLFHIVPLEKNVGLGPALAVGLRNCSYEYISRMDSDDISDPVRCETQLKCFEQNDKLDIVGCFEVEFEHSMDTPVAIHKVPENDDEIKKFMKRRCALLHPTVIYKKSSVLKAGNYHDVRLYEDYDLFMRMVLENNCCSYNVQEGLYYMRINDAFYERRGGIKYLRTVVSFKYRQYKKKFLSLRDFIVSAGGQAFVCLLPNRLRKIVYLKFLR